MDLWPHQQEDVAAILAACDRRESPICYTRPTGMGKSTVFAVLLEHFASQGHHAVLHSNRRLLIEQVERNLRRAGLQCAIRAAGYESRPDVLIQISSIQTEDSRSLKLPAKLRKLQKMVDDGHLDVGEFLLEKWAIEKRALAQLHPAIAIFDEGHLMTSSVPRQLIAQYIAGECHVVMCTATPFGMGDLCRVMIGNGHTSVGRACGALVPCQYFAAVEIDVSSLKTPIGDDFTEKQLRSVMPKRELVGRVIESYRELNPRNLPTILFAPGVGESIYFAEEFSRAGIPAGHIDGDDIWRDGELVRSNREARSQLLEAHRMGEIKVICNRFVLREGIDMPWIRHGIFATCFGSLQSYLQSGGRLLRADRDPVTNERYGPKEFVTLQDHGGHWWRLGSLNADRDYDLDTPARVLVGVRQERIRNGKEPEPMVCPTCGMVTTKRVCLRCHVPAKKGRVVLQRDGRIVAMDETLFPKRREQMRHDTQKEWTRTFWGARRGKKGMTFNEARGWFVDQHHYWPPSTLMFMPQDEYDWFRPVKDVPITNLIGGWEFSQRDHE